jgi:glyoxylase-like metal-dependent hydrolase (beta-lactamase superfamily II)
VSDDSDDSDIYKLYAIRYAERAARRRDHFIGGDPHDGPMPMDYFIWVAVGPTRTVVIDTGFNAAVAAKRGRTHLRCPVEALRLIGIDPATVTDVVITHLHYDHVGNIDRFPAARFHIQEPEMHFTAGHHMKHPHLAHHFEVDDVVSMIRLNFAGRVSMYHGGGPVELAPGLSLHPTGGHSPGLQFARVNTARGWVVVASDASHFYENMEAGRPFTAAWHIGDMLDAFDALYAAAPTPEHVIPGHDPLVMARYPAPSRELEGIVARLDVAPRHSD